MRKIVSIVLLFTASMPLSSQGASTLTPLDVSKIRQVATATISHDGDMIAYTVRKPADPLRENKLPDYDLYLYNRSTGSNMPYVTNGRITGVAFRPGHNSLTFLSKREGDSQYVLYEISLSGGEARPIFSYDASILSYRWSPDGETIAFLARDAAQQQNGLPYEPVVYEEDMDLTGCFIGSIDDGRVRRVELSGHVASMEWNREGSRLAVIAAPTALVDDRYMKQKLYIVETVGLTVTDQIDHPAKLGQYAWSPDGERIALIAGGDIHDPIDGRLFIYRLDDQKLTRLLDDFEGKLEDIHWTNDHTLLYLASVGVESRIGLLSDRGRIYHPVIDRGDVVFQSVSRAADGSMALIGHAPSHPKELFYLAPGESHPTRISELNPWLTDKALGVQEVVRYTARDGTELQGILIRPVDQVAGVRYPLITVVHGGPESHYDNGWLTRYSVPGQVAAGMGYAVFYPNYRGSTGRGEAFAKSSQGDPAGREFDDIIDGIDHLIRQGEVDPERIGVTGGSYGGYATAWMATRYSDRFAAGVMFVGISNNISKWGTSDIPEEMFLVHSRKRLWDDYQFFLKRSPVYHADKARTPLLILHGEDDTRVDPGQSYELYRHIKTRTDTPVRLVLYPGEGHGNRRSAARLDYNLRMMRWFDSFLKGNGPAPDPDLSIEKQSF